MGCAGDPVHRNPLSPPPGGCHHRVTGKGQSPRRPSYDEAWPWPTLSLGRARLGGLHPHSPPHGPTASPRTPQPSTHPYAPGMEQQLRGYRGDGRDAGVGIGGWDSIGRGSSSHKDSPKASQKPAVGSNPNPIMTVPTSPSPDPKSPSPPRPNEKDVTQLSPLPKSFGMRRNKHKPAVSWELGLQHTAIT